MNKLAKISDVVIEALIDAGSQITAIRDDFYQLSGPLYNKKPWNW